MDESSRYAALVMIVWNNNQVWYYIDTVSVPCRLKAYFSNAAHQIIIMLEYHVAANHTHLETRQCFHAS